MHNIRKFANHFFGNSLLRI